MRWSCWSAKLTLRRARRLQATMAPRFVEVAVPLEGSIEFLSGAGEDAKSFAASLLASIPAPRELLRRTLSAEALASLDMLPSGPPAWAVAAGVLLLLARALVLRRRADAVVKASGGAWDAWQKPQKRD